MSRRKQNKPRHLGADGSNEDMIFGPNDAEEAEGSEVQNFGEEEDSLRCKLCKEVFENPADLMAHEDTCEEDNPLTNGSGRLSAPNPDDERSNDSREDLERSRRDPQFSPNREPLVDPQEQFQQALSKMHAQKLQVMKLLGIGPEDLQKPEVQAQLEKLGFPPSQSLPGSSDSSANPFGASPEVLAKMAQMQGNEPKNWQEFLMMQSTLYSLQQQQMLQVQLIHRLQQQLHIGRPEGEVKEEAKKVGESKPDALSLLSKLGSSLQPGLPKPVISSEDKPKMYEEKPLRVKTESPLSLADSIIRHSPPMSATSLALSVIQPSSEPAEFLDQPTSLEMLQRTTQEVLNKASKNLLINSLVDDLAKSPTSGDDKSKEAMMRHRCRYCGKVFGSDSALQIHIRSHTGERPYKCNICGNRFTTKGNLKVHFQRHQAKYPHIKMNPHPVPEHLDALYPPLLPQLEGGQSPPPPPPPPPPAMIKPQMPGGGLRPPNPGSSLFASMLPQFYQNFPIPGMPFLQGLSFNQPPVDQDAPENLTVPNKTGAKRAASPEIHLKMVPEESDEEEPSRKRRRSSGGFRNSGSDQDDQDLPEDLSGNLPSARTPSPSFSSLSTSRPSSPGERLPFRLNKQPSHPPASASAPVSSDPVQDPILYNSLLPRPGSTDNSWESLIEVTPASETSKLQQFVDNIVHKLNDPNECVICHRVLSCKSALQMHYRTHTGERPFKCRICGRAFTTKGNLKTHMSVHRIKPPSRTLHQCPVCHKKYSSPMILEQHIRLHTGEPTDMTAEQIEAGEATDSMDGNSNMSSRSGQYLDESLDSSAASDDGKTEEEGLESPEDRLSKDKDLYSDDNSVAGGACTPEDLSQSDGQKTARLPSASPSSIRDEAASPSPSNDGDQDAASRQASSHSMNGRAFQQLKESGLGGPPRLSFADFSLLQNARPGGNFPASSQAALASLSAFSNAALPRARSGPESPPGVLDLSPKTEPARPAGFVNLSPGLPGSSGGLPALKSAAALLGNVQLPLTHGPPGVGSGFFNPGLGARVATTSPSLISTSLSSLGPSVIHGNHAPHPFGPFGMALAPGFPGLPRGNTTCNVCFKTFACNSALEIHYRSHTKEKPFICPVCNRGFSTKGNMKQHLLTHKKNESPEKTGTNLTVEGKSSAEKAKNSPKPPTSILQSATSSEIISPGEDRKANSPAVTAPESKWVPPIGADNDANKRSRRREPDVVDPAVCVDADIARNEQNSRESDWDREEEKLIKDAQIREPIPVVATSNVISRPTPRAESSSSPPATENGKGTVPIPHRPPGFPKHMCHVCHKNFSSGSALQIHMRTHTGDRPFKCPVCGRAFTTKGNLKVHMGIHMWNGTSRRGRRMSFEFPPPPGAGRHPNMPGSPLNMAAAAAAAAAAAGRGHLQNRPGMPPGPIPTSASQNIPVSHPGVVDAASLLRMHPNRAFLDPNAAAAAAAANMRGNGRRFLESLNPYFGMPHAQLMPQFSSFPAPPFNGLHGKVHDVSALMNQQFLARAGKTPEEMGLLGMTSLDASMKDDEGSNSPSRSDEEADQGVLNLQQQPDNEENSLMSPRSNHSSEDEFKQQSRSDDESKGSPARGSWSDGKLDNQRSSLSPSPHLEAALPSIPPQPRQQQQFHCKPGSPALKSPVAV